MPKSSDGATADISLNEAAYRRLRSDIVTCRLPPGERLTEQSIADQIGMGLSPVRRALTRLDHDGLVQTLPRKGYRVTPLTMKSVDDLFTFVGIIGPELTRLGIDRATADQMKRLRHLAAKAGAPGGPSASPSQRALERTTLTLSWFELLAESTGNDYLISFVERISGDLSRVAWLMEYDVARSPSPAEPGPDIDRLFDGDPEVIAAIGHQLVEEARGRVLKIIGRLPSVMASEVRPG